MAGDPSHPSATSREHRIWEEPGGMLSVMGGKFTTFRAMAEDTVNKARKILGIPHIPSPTRHTALPGAEPAGETGGTFPAGQRERLEGIYGTRAGAVLATATNMKDGFTPLCPHTQRTRAEAVFAVEKELALTLTDIMERRLRLALTCPCRGEDAVENTVEAVAPLLGWDEAEKKRHIDHYLGQLKATRID